MQNYTMPALADDVAWICEEQKLGNPVVVGHSMGNVALELAASAPDLLAAVVMIDSLLFPPQPLLDALKPLEEALQGSNYLADYEQGLSGTCLPTDAGYGPT
jgi:pimeloyl-ACP methyl ester carboxylesterase